MKEQDQERKKIISVNNLSKIYDMGVVKVHALRGIDVDIHKGEISVDQCQIRGSVPCE